MKRRRQVAHPCARKLLAIQHADQRTGIRMRKLTKGIGTDERRHVDGRAHAASPGNAPAGKIRAAFFQLMASWSAGVRPMTSSAQSLASPVSIVMSAPHTGRTAPTDS